MKFALSIIVLLCLAISAFPQGQDGGTLDRLAVVGSDHPPDRHAPALQADDQRISPGQGERHHVRVDGVLEARGLRRRSSAPAPQTLLERPPGVHLAEANELSDAVQHGAGGRGRARRRFEGGRIDDHWRELAG